MEHSSFEPEPALVRNLAKAEMWTYDGRVFDAPTFQLGMAPAGSMFSTVTDLGRFVIAMLAHGQGERGPLLKPETLDLMWQPQSPTSSGAGFGLGFRIADLDHHRMIGHGGAIYGFATSVDMLPDDKLGVIVVATKDVSNGVTERIARETLRLILDHRQGKPLAAPPATTRVPADFARKLAGRYGAGDDAVDLVYLNGKLTLLPVNGGSQVELRRLGNDPSADTSGQVPSADTSGQVPSADTSGQVLAVDSVLSYGTVITPLENAIRFRDKILERVQLPKPAAAPEKWKGLMGEYGWDHDTLYVFEKNGRLSVLIEWIEYEALTEVSENVFEFPKRGLYDGEKAVFTRDASGEATQVRISGVVFKRRQIGGVSGGVFRIQPARSIAVLRKEALDDHPPAEKGDFLKPDLVEIATLDPTIKLDIRYASTNNFLSEPMYSQARAFLQRPAVEAVARANRALNKLGFGLLIHDAYRPWYVTKMFWEATPPDKRIFVANPKEGSRHNRGCAVDLSLYDLATGKPIEMVGVYDEMSERSYPGYPGGTSLQRWHRDLLRSAMEQQGFEVYEFEWWHFDYKDWRRYPILNLTFDQIPTSVRGPAQMTKRNPRPRDLRQQNMSYTPLPQDRFPTRPPVGSTCHAKRLIKG
jgi:D-alanyl-D-alanine dipeptidase